MVHLFKPVSRRSPSIASRSKSRKRCRIAQRRLAGLLKNRRRRRVRARVLQVLPNNRYLVVGPVPSPDVIQQAARTVFAMRRPFVRPAIARKNLQQDREFARRESRTARGHDSPHHIDTWMASIRGRAGIRCEGSGVRLTTARELTCHTIHGT